MHKPVGMFYMPNWSSVYPPGAQAWQLNPWGPLRPFGKEPLKGYYEEDKQHVMDQTLRECNGHGVDYLSFDYFHDHTTRAAVGDHALRNYLASAVPHGVQFNVALDTRNWEVPVVQMRDWMDIVYQLAALSDNPNYLKVRGRPVLQFISTGHFHNVVSFAAGASPKALLDILREKSGKNWYVVAGCHANPHWTWQAALSGVDAYGMYNLFQNKFTLPEGPKATNWDELVACHVASWNWLASNLATHNLELWLPMMAGWDSRPLNGTLIADPDPFQLRPYFEAADAFIRDHPIVTGACIDAYNEHTEGSTMEPSVRHGRARLGVYQSVFKP